MEMLQGTRWAGQALPEREELFRCDTANSSALLSPMRPDKHKISPGPAAARAVKVAADAVTFADAGIAALPAPRLLLRSPFQVSRARAAP